MITAQARRPAGFPGGATAARDQRLIRRNVLAEIHRVDALSLDLDGDQVLAPAVIRPHIESEENLW
jgi:hypothetical protein